MLSEPEELHNVESLDARDQELYRFAEEFGLESYDGMDVGPIDDPLCKPDENASA